MNFFKRLNLYCDLFIFYRLKLYITSLQDPTIETLDHFVKNLKLILKKHLQLLTSLGL